MKLELDQKSMSIVRMSAIKSAVDLCVAGKIELNDIETWIEKLEKIIMGE